jgi:hypothetical protein
MTVPFKPAATGDFEIPHRLTPVDEKVSSMLGVILIVFAMLLLAADLSATIIPRIQHHHKVNPAVVEVHRQVDWQKTDATSKTQ